MNEELKIFVTPSQDFKALFRGIFAESKSKFVSGVESKIWLAKLDMKK